MKSNTTRDVARLVGLSEAQVRSQARVGYLSPDRGPSNAYSLRLEDLGAAAHRQAATSDTHPAPRRIRGPSGPRPCSSRRSPVERAAHLLRRGSGRGGAETVASAGIRSRDSLLLLDPCRRPTCNPPEASAPSPARARARGAGPLAPRRRPPRAGDRGVPRRARGRTPPIPPPRSTWAPRSSRSTGPSRRSRAYRRALRNDDDMADAHLGLARVYGGSASGRRRAVTSRPARGCAGSGCGSSSGRAAVLQALEGGVLPGGPRRGRDRPSTTPRASPRWRSTHPYRTPKESAPTDSVVGAGAGEFVVLKAARRITDINRLSDADDSPAYFMRIANVLGVRLDFPPSFERRPRYART